MVAPFRGALNRNPSPVLKSASMKPRYRRMLRGMRSPEGRPPPGESAGAAWFLYILECRDGSLYTGVTTDVERRLREHQAGTASRYTRARRPVNLVLREKCGSRSRALSRECAVKSLGRRRKEELIRGKASNRESANE
jgi:putative endonuclease